MSARARFVLGGDWRLAKLSAACALTAVLITSCAQNATPQPDALGQRSAAERAARNAYELQESCGRTARESFRQFFPDETDPRGSVSSTHSFENHYNAKDNRCYMLESSLIETKGKPGASSLTTVKELIDVNENRVLGQYFESLTRHNVDQCSMEGQMCQSSAAWDALAKPFMER